jgi:hypothetical protein
MTVPKAAMDKYHGRVLRKHYVGIAGQVFSVQPESKAEAMQQ